MSYLSDSHGYLIETRKKISVVIFATPLVAHIRVGEGGFYVRLIGENDP